MLKKLALILLSSVLFLSSMVTPFAVAHAEDQQPSTWYNQGFTDWYVKVYGKDSPPSEIFGERYTAAQVEWILYGLFSFILNHVSDQATTVECIQGDPVACGDAIKQSIEKFQKIIDDNKTADSGKSLNSLVFSYRSFSGIGYLREKAQNLYIIPEAKAQTSGFGFGALDPIKSLWSASRNFAYALSVLAILVLAFMIMFRVKISPQVVVSAQSAIPKVISALIFVTFSYAIAGFLVDLMYVTIGLNSLALGQVIATPAKNFIMMTSGIFGFGGFLMNMVAYSAAFFWILIFVLFLGSGNLGANLALTATGILPIVFIILILIAAIVLLFLIFRIFWLLLKTLAQIYLLVVVGPLQIIFGTVVQGMSVGNWMKSLAANLAVYPIVGVLFQLSFLMLYYSFALGLGNLLGEGTVSTFSQAFFGQGMPYPTSSWSPPLTLGERYVPLVFLGISFVLLTMIPKTAEIIQGFISGKPFAYGTAIGEAITSPFTTALRLGSTAREIGTSYTTRFGTRTSPTKTDTPSGPKENEIPPELR
jgi:hypothetical protein